MDKEHLKLIESMVTDLLYKYIEQVNQKDDENHYMSAVTAVLVFKNLVALEFKKNLINDTGGDVDDICELMEDRAKEIADSIRNRMSQMSQMTN